MSTAVASPSSLTAEYVNPLIDATKQVFQTMLGCTPTRTGLSLRGMAETNYEISAIVGLSGRASGAVVLTLPTETALSVLDRLVGMERLEVTDEVCDAVGELASMIAGFAKSRLERLSLSASVPSIVTGTDHQVRFPSNVHPICVYFESEIGDFAIEVGVGAND